MRVLDASAIVRSDFDFSDDVYAISPTVLSEIKTEDIRSLIDLAIGRNDIKILSPGKKAHEKVSEASGETGDAPVLSEADVDVLALALEHGAEVLSDDYAIQNVAKHLNIPIIKSVHEGIKKFIKWEMACTGCGKRFGVEAVKTCEVCGAKVNRRPKRD